MRPSSSQLMQSFLITLDTSDEQHKGILLPLTRTENRTVKLELEQQADRNRLGDFKNAL